MDKIVSLCRRRGFVFPSSEIYEELEQAKKLHRRLRCPVIDISELSIEETAHRILRVVEERAGETKAQAAR